MAFEVTYQGVQDWFKHKVEKLGWMTMLYSSINNTENEIKIEVEEIEPGSNNITLVNFSLTQYKIDLIKQYKIGLRFLDKAMDEVIDRFTNGEVKDKAFANEIKLLKTKLGRFIVKVDKTLPFGPNNTLLAGGARRKKTSKKMSKKVSKKTSKKSKK
jgi:hypothetical protein